MNGTTRRGLVKRGAALGLGASALGGVAGAAPASCGVSQAGPLMAPDANGLMLPRGFQSRVVAVSGQPVGSSGYIWHQSPDGGATFSAGDGGWVYVSNAERSNGQGGVGALRFNAAGDVVDAYSILSGTTRNCAGGPTPWGTWLSCEETSDGEVWECDPFAPGSQGVVRPWMGKFCHEAAAVDSELGHIYLTEDESNGLLYRYTPSTHVDVPTGVLQAAEVLDPLGQGSIAPGEVRHLAWHVVPDPTLTQGFTPTRFQVPVATRFKGGEGAWYRHGQVYFTTKGDNRVWRLDTRADQIEIVYDLATTTQPDLSGVDNVYVSPCGDVLVAEDGGDLQIVALTADGQVKPIVQLVGVSGSEITGPALSPDGSRLYFSSQRNPGTTFEVVGPFLEGERRALGVPAIGTLGTAMTGAAIAAARRLLSRRNQPDARTR